MLCTPLVSPIPKSGGRIATGFKYLRERGSGYTHGVRFSNTDYSSPAPWLKAECLSCQLQQGCTMMDKDAMSAVPEIVTWNLDSLASVTVLQVQRGDVTTSFVDGYNSERCVCAH